MSRWLNKVGLLMWKESLLLVRTRKGILLLIVIIGLGVFSQLLERFGTQTPQATTCPQTLFTTYLSFLQLLPLALAIILADSMSGERERGTWRFFMSKPVSSAQLLVSKALVYTSSVGFAVLLMWMGMTAFAFLSDQSGCRWQQVVLTFAVLQAVAFAVIAFEIKISSLTRRIAVAVLLIVLGWLALTIINVATPVGRGFLAPWATNSFQANIVARFLGISFPVTPFESLIGQPTTVELWLAGITPLALGAAFYLIAGTLAIAKRD